MVRLREVPRTAAFAWSPGTELPWIATGTKAGAVDADFSTETVLELWDLHLESRQQPSEFQPAASIVTDSRFFDIAWARVKGDQSIIAGALENGSLDLWDANRLMDGEDDALVSRASKHSGAVKSLQFNPFRSELLATAGAKGELFVWDLNNVASPFRLGSSAARADDVETIDWNKKVPHILVTGGGGGFVTVWDVKAKKESLTLKNLGRKAVSAVAWDPAQSTKLATAIPDDTNPLILVWDLRHSNAPERTLRAHEQGVLSLSWCPQDPDLLLSCGKDNRTVCWNPQTGEAYGEFPVVTNWTFQTRWNPHDPSVLATASFDGKITVQTIQNANSAGGQAAASKAQALDGEDFFDRAQTEPRTAGFSLPKPPRWLERPVGAAFGFGGKIVSFRPTAESSRTSKVRISRFTVDAGIGDATAVFEKALAEDDWASICQARIAHARTEHEKADWEVLQTLISDHPRRKLIESLGFSHDDQHALPTAAPTATIAGGEEAKETGPDSTKPPPVDGAPSATVNDHRLSSFFDHAGDGDDFLADRSATKGAKTNDPFQIYAGTESEPDRQITKALILGQFETAMKICLREERMSDAIIVAICGGKTCMEKAQAAYFSKKSPGPNYVRLLESVVGKNLWDVVDNANLSDWKEVMATLCTFADEDEFADLCEGLGDRLEEEMRTEGGDRSDQRKHASFCYLAGSKLDKVVALWIEESQEDERAGFQRGEADSSFSLHARALQGLIEKVTVFREVTKFQDLDLDRSAGWKLSALYDRYTEYADIVAAHGLLEVAEKYLDLLPSKYAAAEVARSRVKQANQKLAASSNSKQTNLPSRAATARNPQQQQAATAARPAVANPYPPATIPQQPSAPNVRSSPSSYAPVGYQQLPQQQQQQQQRQQQQQQQQQPYGPGMDRGPGGYHGGPAGSVGPPRHPNASPAVPPPPRTSEANWNDTPMVVKPPTARRGTPGLGVPPTSQFGVQPQPFPYAAGGGGPSQSGPQPRATPPLPPPPKGSAPPPRMTSPSMVGPPPSVLQPERPPSVTGNQYAPPAFNQPASSMLSSMPPPMGMGVSRGLSPYNPPPTGGSPSNRYAPALAPANMGQMDPQGRNLPPPPPPPPPSQSVPGPGSRSLQYAPPQSQYAPQALAQGHPHGQHPLGYPPGAPQAQPYPSAPSPQLGQHPSTQGGPLQGSDPASSQQSRSTPQPPPPSRHPPGDRSHLPDVARPVFEILSADMQRVKAKAPASFKPQVLDTEKRLNILFDHLNNETLLQPDMVMSMQELAMALRDRDYENASMMQLDLHTNKVEQCGQWMVGVKRLIGMSRATP